VNCKNCSYLFFNYIHALTHSRTVKYNFLEKSFGSLREERDEINSALIEEINKSASLFDIKEKYAALVAEKKTLMTRMSEKIYEVSLYNFAFL